MHVFKSQRMPDKVVVWSASDFAGCTRSRRSTSGGAIMFGGHCVKTYSLTQDNIALSVGVAEFYGILKAGSYVIGVVNLFRDLGIEVSLQVNTDSSIGKSISSRKGVGKIRHLDTRELWTQKKVARGQVGLNKVPGGENLADILTKHVSRTDLYRHMRSVGIERRSGRHPLSPSIQGWR